MVKKEKYICLICNKEIISYSLRKYCSNECYKSSRVGKKQSKETCEKRSKTMVGRKYSEERIRKSALAKRKVLDKNLVENIRELLDFGMPDGHIFQKYKIDYTIFKRLKKELYPNGIPWQIKFLNKDIDISVCKEIVKLSQLKIRYKKIAEKVGLDPKTVKRVLNHLSKRDPNIKCYSYDSTCWNNSISNIEILISEFLSSEEIEFETQFRLPQKENMPYDFFIKNTNILIEVNGDYWHCNPEIYKKAINDYQSWAQRRDFYKKDLANKFGFCVYTIWENDIKKNFDQVKIRLKEKIQNARNNFNNKTID